MEAKLESSETKKHVGEAFAGESQANRKYLKFAEVAEKEGFPEIAKLFRETAEQETAHAMAWMKELGIIGTTAENLNAAIDGEAHEYTKMYPQFAKVAENEGFVELAKKFRLLAAIEERHANAFRRALEGMKKSPKGEDGGRKKYACPRCGYVAEGEAPRNCPICGLEGSSFKAVNV